MHERRPSSNRHPRRNKSSCAAPVRAAAYISTTAKHQRIHCPQPLLHPPSSAISPSTEPSPPPPSPSPPHPSPQKCPHYTTPLPKPQTPPSNPPHPLPTKPQAPSSSTPPPPPPPPPTPPFGHPTGATPPHFHSYPLPLLTPPYPLLLSRPRRCQRAHRRWCSSMVRRARRSRSGLVFALGFCLGFCWFGGWGGRFGGGGGGGRREEGVGRVEG
ncbi:hypothetical protein EJ04DRAFT_527294 [Polyplosphaeria fusca]|uniref:Uncharacterized protein n=1 Tax=Polyplosphaeria fusca TaxID=682080 RepID=A0A9P4QRF8_9PLEO|nr:hypothetical protein EJ04DRAFT_527294 [Polyplosphaeria fusca]